MVGFCGFVPHTLSCISVADCDFLLTVSGFTGHSSREDSSRDDGEGAVLFAGGADGDFDVLAEGGEKFH
jgi:hypothetical protein